MSSYSVYNPVDNTFFQEFIPDVLNPLMEALAENVHDTWAAGRLADGWKYGPERNDTMKQHPCLVPYNDLPEEEKEYDRQTAKATIAFILSKGYDIVKIQISNNITTMQLNKEEFKTLVMLYAANIDGNIHPEEVEVMLEKADVSTFKKVSKLFKKMGDNEVLECIRANKGRFAATAEDREQLLNGFRSVIQADERCTTMEKYLLKAIERIL